MSKKLKCAGDCDEGYGRCAECCIDGPGDPMRQNSLAAVRERLTIMRARAALVYAPCPHRAARACVDCALHRCMEIVDSGDVEWTANALEDVLDYAPCDYAYEDDDGYLEPCHGYGARHQKGLGTIEHDYEPPTWLEAALARVTATTEGAR